MSDELDIWLCFSSNVRNFARLCRVFFRIFSMLFLFKESRVRLNRRDRFVFFIEERYSLVRIKIFVVTGVVVGKKSIN